MKKYILFLFTFLVFTTNAQKVSQSEAFQKAQKFMGDKKLKVPSTTRGEDVVKPYYIFNAEDGNGSIIVSGDKRLPDVLVYSKVQSIDENNIPNELKKLVPILEYDNDSIDIYDPYLIPSEYIPRSTTPIPSLTFPTNIWRQTYPFNQYCPIIFPNKEDEKQKPAYVGCTPLAVAIVMNYFKYPKSVNSFETTIGIEMPNENEVNSMNVSVPYTEFKWDLIRNDSYGYNSRNQIEWLFSNEEGKAVAELCYHVGLAFKASYKQTGTYTNSNQVWCDWVNVMKNIYKYDEVKFLQGYTNEDENGNVDYFEIDDEEYWNFLDSYLEKGVPVITSGGGHSFVIDGRDDKGMYNYNSFYVILQPSLWRKIGTYGALIKNNYYLHLLAFIPPNWKTSTTINCIEIVNYHNDMVYNLHGYKVGYMLKGLPSGLYIKNGKKIFVK